MAPEMGYCHGDCDGARWVFASAGPMVECSDFGPLPRPGGWEMRLRKEMIERISVKIVDRLLRREIIEINADEEAIRNRIVSLIEADLMVEDRLNDEVKDILRDHQDEMDKDNVDYSRMFTMVKTKLARERNLVL
jgi:hypothetical protein